MNDTINLILQFVGIWAIASFLTWGAARIVGKIIRARHRRNFAHFMMKTMQRVARENGVPIKVMGYVESDDGKRMNIIARPLTVDEEATEILKEEGSK